LPAAADFQLHHPFYDVRQFRIGKPPGALGDHPFVSFLQHGFSRGRRPWAGLSGSDVSDGEVNVAADGFPGEAVEFLPDVFLHEVQLLHPDGGSGPDKENSGAPAVGPGLQGDLRAGRLRPELKTAVSSRLTAIPLLFRAASRISPMGTSCRDENFLLMVWK
jgi:hypothetical protein